jgi:hypothetical protein
MNEQTSAPMDGAESFLGGQTQGQVEPTPEKLFKQQISDGQEQAFQNLLEMDVTPPDNLTEYNLGFADNESDSTNPEFIAIDGEVRGMLRTAQMPANIANTLAQTANAYVEYSQHFTPEQHELQRQTTMSRLERLYGDELGQKLQAARSFIKTVDASHNGLMSELLETHGLGNSVEVVNQIIQHAERIALVNKGRASKARKG